MADTPWDTPIQNPQWEQDFGNVKLVHNAPPVMSMDDAVTGPLREDLAAAHRASPAEEAKTQLLNLAYCHAERAVNELEQAVAWFSVVDRSDHSEVVRLVEGLADTIAYRLRNAGQ